MRKTPRFLAGVILAGGLTVLPLASTMHAAPASGTMAAKAREVSAHVNLDPNFVASVLGISTTALKQDLQAGKTLLQIAGSAYATASDLATALLAPIKVKLDHAVATNQMTAARESQTYADTLSEVETLVVTPHPDLGAGGPVDPGVGLLFKLGLLTTLATNCDTTVGALGTAIKAGGTSIMQFCQRTNPGATAFSLATALTAAATAALDAQVTAGTLASSQEAEILTDVRTNLVAWLTQPLQAATAAKAGMEVRFNLAKSSLFDAVAASCDTTAAALDTAIKAGGKSVLQICQSTNPGATVASLESAVIAAIKTKLDAAVSAGQLTASQENAILNKLQATLGSWLTTPLGSGGIGAI